MSEKKPKAVYVIIEKDSLEKSIWTRVGSAFVNRDDSLSVILDALPVGGKLHIREPREWPRDESGKPEREAA